MIGHQAERIRNLYVFLAPGGANSSPARGMLPRKWNKDPPNWLGWLPKLNIEGAHLPAPSHGHNPAMSGGTAD